MSSTVSRRMSICRHFPSILAAFLYLLSYNSVISLNSADFTFGLRLDASTLSRGQLEAIGEVPLVLTNVFKGLDTDKWTSELMTRLGDETIEYDSRRSLDGHITSYEAELRQFVSSLSDNSDHEDSLYLMNEDILNQPAAESLMTALTLPKDLFGDDLLQHFPAKIRPKSALIIGGMGARSFLHADPYEWMGWNLLLEGLKLWTFLPPSVPPSLLRARRHAPDAWGQYNISAGWVSDLDLYRFPLHGSTRRPAGKRSTRPAKPKPATTLNQMLAEAHARAGARAGKESTAAAVSASPLFFESGDPHLDHWPAAMLPLAEGCIQILQREGELVTIPPFYWHQVLHLQPSIAVASQYVSEQEQARDGLFQHMLAWSHGGHTHAHAHVHAAYEEAARCTAPSPSPSAPQSTEAGPKPRPSRFDLPADAVLALGGGEGGDRDVITRGRDSNKAAVLAVIRECLRLQHGATQGDALFELLL